MKIENVATVANFENVKIANGQIVQIKISVFWNVESNCKNQRMMQVKIKYPKRTKTVYIKFDDDIKCVEYGHKLPKLTGGEVETLKKLLQEPYKYPQVFEMGERKFDVKTNWEYAIYQWELEKDFQCNDMALKTDENGFVIFPPMFE